jgi:hypothetical protein
LLLQAAFLKPRTWRIAFSFERTDATYVDFADRLVMCSASFISSFIGDVKYMNAFFPGTG